MIIEERKEKILAILAKHKFMKLTELESVTRTSLSTLRRDLQDLEVDGKVKRVHGGVQLLDHMQSELSVSEKQTVHPLSKQRIAKSAVNLLDDGAIIFLDAGTTTAEMIPYLSEKHLNITVVTNSVHHAARLSDLMIPTIIVGGYIKQTTDATIGAAAVTQIQQMAFDACFIGANAIDEKHGLTTPDLEEAAIKRTVIEQSKNSYVLADSSKLNQFAFAQIVSLNQVILVTNAIPDELSHLKKSVQVIEVDNV